MLVHVVTKKGKGYPPAEAADDKYHGVARSTSSPARRRSPRPTRPPIPASSPTRWSSEARRRRKDRRHHRRHAGGHGARQDRRRFPERVFDVGIAEQHAVTFAAGLATEGFRPFCAIYSTFLQRGYDQVVHDVAIQNLPVRFAIDRAGLVGADGATHAGAFDIAYLACLPNMTVMAAADEAELVHMVATAAAHRRRADRASLSARRGRRRRPAGARRALPIGKGRIVREGTRIAILSLGTRLGEAPEGGRGAGGARPLDHGRRRALRQAARPRAHAQLARDAQAPDHRRGRRGRRLRRACAELAERSRRARERASRCAR